MRHAVTADSLLEMFLELKGTAPGKQYHQRYIAFKQLVQDNQQQLYDLIFSGNLDSSYLPELILFGGHGGSCARRYNEDWVPFVARVRERKAELPTEAFMLVEWLHQTCGW